MTLTAAQIDRVIGALLATAAGDALGAAYEFGPPAARKSRSPWWGAGASAGNPVSGPEGFDSQRPTVRAVTSSSTATMNPGLVTKRRSAMKH